MTDDGRLLFPRALVEDVIANAVKSFVMYGRGDGLDLEVSSSRVHVGSGGPGRGGGRACVPAGACRGWRVGWGTLLEPARPNASAGPGTGAAARRSAAECRGVWRGGLRAPCGGPSPAAMFGMLEAGASGGCATPRTRAATRGAAHVLRALRRGGGGGKAAWADSHESAQGAREARADADVRGARECPPAPRGAHRAPLGGRTRVHFRVCSRARGCVQPRARRL